MSVLQLCRRRRRRCRRHENGLRGGKQKQPYRNRQGQESVHDLQEIELMVSYGREYLYCVEFWFVGTTSSLDTSLCYDGRCLYFYVMLILCDPHQVQIASTVGQQSIPHARRINVRYLLEQSYSYSLVLYITYLDRLICRWSWYDCIFDALHQHPAWVYECRKQFCQRAWREVLFKLLARVVNTEKCHSLFFGMLDQTNEWPMHVVAWLQGIDSTTWLQRSKK